MTPTIRVLTRVLAVVALIVAWQFGLKQEKSVGLAKRSLQDATYERNFEEGRKKRLAEIQLTSRSPSWPLEQALAETLLVFSDEAKSYGLVGTVEIVRAGAEATKGEMNWRDLGSPIEGQQRARSVSVSFRGNYRTLEEVTAFLDRLRTLPVAITLLSVAGKEVRSLTIEVFGVVNSHATE